MGQVLKKAVGVLIAGGIALALAGTLPAVARVRTAVA